MSSPDAIEYLRELTAATAEACRLRSGGMLPASSSSADRNELGLDVFLPSGRDYAGYSAVWLRDFVMSVPALDLPGDYLQQAARLFAASQRREPWTWHNGQVPAWTPAEHINLDGGRCYYPGGYFADERQGGMWGPLPPMDSAFYFIHLVHHAWRGQGADCLRDDVDGVSLFERASNAFDAVTWHPDSGLPWSPARLRACDFGFCDTVHKLGCVLFGSCLAYRSAVCLEEMAHALGAEGQKVRFHSAAARIREHIVPVFATPDGFLNAATEVCRQRDVWGTAYAVYAGALDGESRDRACGALREACRNRTAVRDGAVRHILPGDDWSENSAWEYAYPERGTYQNGGYWLTPSGWYLYAVSRVDPETGRQMFAEMIAHLRSTDFRLGGDRRGPYEWHNPETGRHGHAVNLTSVSGPLAAVERILDEGLWG